MARLLYFHDFLVRRQINRERIFRDRENPLDFLSDVELYERFRFDRQSIYFLTDLLKDELNSTNRNRSLLPTQQLLIALRYYATGTFQIVCGDTVHVEKSSANMAISKVTKGLAIRRNNFICMPSEAEMVRVKSGFYRIANFPGIWDVSTDLIFVFNALILTNSST